MPQKLFDDESTMVQVTGTFRQQDNTWANVDPDLCQGWVFYICG